MNYKNKYLKYKLKYINIKKLYGGMEVEQISVEDLIDNFIENDNPQEYKNNHIKQHLENNQELYEPYLKSIMSDDIFIEDKSLNEALFIDNNKYYLLDIFENHHIQILASPFMDTYLNKIKDLIENGTSLYFQNDTYLVIDSIFNFIIKNKNYLSEEQKNKFWDHTTVVFIIKTIENTFDIDILKTFTNLLKNYDRALTDEERPNLDAHSSGLLSALEIIISNEEYEQEDINNIREIKEYFESKTPQKPQPTSFKQSNTAKRPKYNMS